MMDSADQTSVRTWPYRGVKSLGSLHSTEQGLRPEIGRKMAGMSGTTPENMELFLMTCISSTAVPKAYLKSIGVN